MHERAAIDTAARRRLDRRVLRRFLAAVDLLGLAVGKVIADVRAHADPLAAQAITIVELKAQLAAAERKVAVLQRRLDRLPARRRPHVDPASRFDVLEVRALLRESAAATAEWCRVSAATVLRWEAELKQHPARRTIGSLLRAVPPVRRYADAERRLVQWMDRMGFRGSATIASTLARVGRRIAPTTVGRIRKEKALPAPEPPKVHLVEGRYPNHVWIADETEIPALFRIFSFKLLLVMDAFSRFPVAARLSLRSTTANDVVEILQRASPQHGGPRHLVTDKGRPFRSKTLATELRRQGIRHRFGAVGQHGSIALVERLFKTLKYAFSLRHPFTVSRDVAERRLNLVLVYYAYLRPHQSLDGATPAEIYLQITPAHRSATPPPRGRRGDVTEPPPFEVVHLDDEKRLPVLVPNAA